MHRAFVVFIRPDWAAVQAPTFSLAPTKRPSYIRLCEDDLPQPGLFLRDDPPVFPEGRTCAASQTVFATP